MSSTIPPAVVGLSLPVRQKPSIPELRIVIDQKESTLATISGTTTPSSNISPGQLSPSPSTSFSSPYTGASDGSSNTQFTNTSPFGDSNVHPKRNLKKLSLTSLNPRPSPSTLSLRSISIPPPQSAISLPPSPHVQRKFSLQPPPSAPSALPTRRRSSVVSLPSTMVHRSVEDGNEGAPYEDGAVEILPGVFLGSEENARDWLGLAEQSIGAILNVAKEVAPPHGFSEARTAIARAQELSYEPDALTGRPALTYLHLPWSHGQADLVKVGFLQAMEFIDSSVARGTGVLIHCQCGVSRSATLAIAYVMRAAQASDANNVVRALKNQGMQGAYNFVKEKSQWIGPNMSLIYQLLEYERYLTPNPRAPSDSSGRSEEEEWSRQRLAMEEEMADNDGEDDGEVQRTAIEAAEARELDQRMIDRLEGLKRQSSSSSFGSGNGLPWKSRHSGIIIGRSRAGSVESNHTSRSSMISEDSLLEVDEESEDADGDMTYTNDDTSRSRTSSLVHSIDEEEDGVEEDEEEGGTFISLPPTHHARVQNARTIVLPPPPAPRRNRLAPPSAPATQTSFTSASGAKRSGPPSLSLQPPRSRSIGGGGAIPPSAPATQTSFGPPPSASATQTTFGNIPHMSMGGGGAIAFPPQQRSQGGGSTFKLPPRQKLTRVPSSLATVPSSPEASTLDEISSERVFPLGGKKGRKPVPLRLASSSASSSSFASSSIVEQDEDPKPTHHPLVLEQQRKPRRTPMALNIPTKPPLSNVVIQSRSSSSSSLSSSHNHDSASSSSSSRSGSRPGKLRPSHPLLYATQGQIAPLTGIGSATPHQTLFIFPASPTRTGTATGQHGTYEYNVPPTPSTMMLTTTTDAAMLSDSSSTTSSSLSSVGSSARKRLSALPSGMTPTLAAFRSSIQSGVGRRGGVGNRNNGNSWAGVPSTPTTATARVEARGWVGSSGMPPPPPPMTPRRSSHIVG